MTTILVPVPTKGGDHGAHPIGEDGRLIGGRRGLALDRRLGIHDFEDRFLRKLNRHRNALMYGERHLHLRLQVGCLVTNDVGRQGYLVIGLGIHEMEAVAVLIKVLVLAVLHICAFDLLGGLVALCDLYPIADSAHVHLRGRSTLAGMEALGVEHDIELAVEFHDIALAERAGDDFHGRYSSVIGQQEQMLGRTNCAAPY